MGRASRWLKGLFGIKKDKYQTEPSNSGDKKGSFGHSGRGSAGLCHNPATIPPNITPAEASWLRSFYSEPDNEQSKHAIAVAAATAAAADAAVAAAQAAVAVVRLTSQGRDTAVFGRERWAAVKIQTNFRGYLSRKALRALKGLVKLQALVRGYMVRKQATATLHGIEALIRAQATVRAQKTRPYLNTYGGGSGGGGDCFHPQFRSRKSIEKFDDTRSEQHTTTIHSRRLSSSSSFETQNPNPLDDETPKIVEIDTGTNRPKSRSRRTNTCLSDSGDSSGVHSLFSHHTPATRLSIPTRRNPEDSGWDLAGDGCRCSSGHHLSSHQTPATHLWTPTSRNPQDSGRDLTGDECRCCTAQSTPRFANSSCGSHTSVVTPARSVCVDNFFRQYANFPNYMASTQSFKAKLRSQSAPKLRPTGHKKKLSLSEMMESRSSVSGVKMQSSCSKVEEVLNFKNVVMGKFDRSSDFY